MRKMLFIGLAATLVAGAAVARDNDAARDLAKALAGHVPGKTSECIALLVRYLRLEEKISL